MSTTGKYPRHPDALLAGVCAGLAQRLGWNAWAVRGLAVLGLMLHALAAGGLYLLFAILIPVLGISSTEAVTRELASPELGDRQKRIAALERRFRDLENDTAE